MNALTITAVHAWECLDSRGRPTVGCRVTLGGGATGRVVVPSGASTGSHEAVERRDGGLRYGGWGVRDAVTAVLEELAPAVLGRDCDDRPAIDHLLEDVDGTPDLSRVGANAVLGISLAVTVARAEALGLPLWRSLDDDPEPLIPLPMVNILSGGAHAGGAVELQDFLAVPVGADSATEAIEWVSDVRRACSQLVDERGGWSALIADEGGLSARLASNEAVLALLTEGIDRSGHVPGDEVAVAIDVAANQLMHGEQIAVRDAPEPLTASEWLDVVTGWCGRYPLLSVEDVLAEDDWDGWAEATRRLGHLQLLGDDLFVTDARRLARGVAEHVGNAVLVKVNQAGTVSRAEGVVRAAQAAGYATVVSARSGDTEDAWLADLAVGWRAGQIKVGSTMRSERTAKWNRLMEIESQGPARFAGRSVLAPRPA